MAATGSWEGLPESARAVPGLRSAEGPGESEQGRAWGAGASAGPQAPLLGCSLYNPSPPLHSFLTKRGREVWAHPREAWVQEYVTDLELNP